MLVSIRESLLEVSAELAELVAFVQGANGSPKPDGLTEGQVETYNNGQDCATKEELAAAVLAYLQNGYLVERLRVLATNK